MSDSGLEKASQAPKCCNVADGQANNKVHEDDAHHDEEGGEEDLGHPGGGRVVHHQVEKVKLTEQHRQNLHLTILKISGC